MAQQGNTGIKRIINAARFSWQGLKAVYNYEEAFRQETWLFIILFPIGLYLGANGMERAMLILPLFVVLITEILNSAVEAAIDRFGGDHHELSGRAKDMGSAAVLFSLILVPVVWGLVLYPKYV